MKANVISVLIVLLSTALTHGQGSYVYDQVSSTSLPLTTPGFGTGIELSQPGGQSFTPALSSLGFIRVNVCDGDPANGLGATVYVVLHVNSITGPILGTSDPVFMSDNFAGAPYFMFTTPVAVTPGVTYYFQPAVEAGGDVWNALSGGYNYPGGNVFFQGNPQIGSDLWFQEGIVVPEPASVWLALVCGGSLLYVRRFKQSALRS